MCDFTQPYDHSPPVHHAALQVQLRDWPDECVWAQLQYERWADARTEHEHAGSFLENLETEWKRRGICSRCHRGLDSGLGQQMTELEARVHDAEDKLGRIRRLVPVTSDQELRVRVNDILGER